MKKVTTIYTCDTCRKQEVRENNGNDRDYPFDKGWVRLDSINIGIPVRASHRLIDQPSQFEAEGLDFCSPRCFSERMKQEFLNRGEVATGQANEVVQDEIPKYQQRDSPVMGRSNTPVNQGDLKHFQQNLSPNSEFQRFEEVPEPVKKKGWFGKKRK